jgi:hypothetical protein
MDREQDIHFIYENGVLRPDEPVNLPEGARGIAHIRAASPPAAGPPQDLYGAWRGTFPSDVDLDAALGEVRTTA